MKIFLSGRPGSNRRHSAWKADALPTELLPQFQYKYKQSNFSFARKIVGISKLKS